MGESDCTFTVKILFHLWFVVLLHLWLVFVTLKVGMVTATFIVHYYNYR